VAVRRLEQPLARAVAGNLRGDDLGPADDEAFGQPRAHGLGDVGHRIEIGDAAMVQPVENLLGAQLRRLGVQPGFGEQFGDARAGKTDQIDAPVSAWRNVARNGNRIDVSGDRHDRNGCHGWPYTDFPRNRQSRGKREHRRWNLRSHAREHDGR
jgi:hypothetical protein